MFRGHYEHNTDSKGRVSVPAKFRDIISVKYDSDIIMVTRLEQALVAYPMTEWTILEEKLLSLPQFKQNVKSFQRYFLSFAVECTLDKQGRILIPANLREFAKIDKEIVFLGLLDKFEIWSKELWTQEEEKSRSNFENNSEILGELGI